MKPLLAALATAALLVLAAPGIAPARPFALLAWIAFAPLLAVLPSLGPRRAALVAWLAGFALHVGLYAWLPGLMARFSGTSLALAAPLALLVWALAALPWALFGALVPLLRRALPRGWPFAAAALFVAIERWAPLPFPYSLGLTQHGFLWLAQGAELGGPSVLTFLFVLVGAALVELVDARREGRPAARPILVAAAALPLALLGFGALRLAQIRAAWGGAPAARVALVQASYARKGLRAEPDGPEILARYQALSAAAERAGGPFDLIVWPEKADPQLIRRDARHDYPPGNPRRVRVGFASPLLFGAQAVDVTTRELSNAAVLLERDDRARVAYEKVRLIAYSERLPGWLAFLGPRSQRYRPGASLAPVTLEDGTRVGVFICFESSFPDHVRALVAREPGFLANLSDDAWFGDGAEPEQHLAQVVFRAIESRRDVVRAAGAGISAHVAATGEVIAALGVRRAGDGDEGTTTLIVAPRKLGGGSVFARVGDLFSLACAIAAAAAVGLGLRRGRGGGGRASVSSLR